MTNAERKIAEAILSHQVDLLRLSGFAQNQALALLDSMGAELTALLRKGNLTEFGKNRLNILLRQATEIIDRYYTAISETHKATAAGAAGIQGNVVEGAMLRVSLEAAIPTTTHLAAILSDSLVEGAKTAAWWDRQAGDVAFRFASEVRQGLIQGQTNEQIVARVAGSSTRSGVMDVARSNARSLVQSSIQQVANDARLETFRKNRDVIKGVRQLSTLDSHTTEICIAYADGEWDLDGEPLGDTELPFNGGPPRHWGCRSVLVPITKTFKELGLGIPEFGRPQQATAGGPTSLTLHQWLDTRTKEELNDQLGVGKADLYRKGKISLQQLLDQRGNPLTLKQLERKYK